MMKKLLNLLNWASAPEPQESLEVYFLEMENEVTKLDITQNDATRPSYRISKRQASDFYKAIDLSG